MGGERGGAGLLLFVPEPLPQYWPGVQMAGGRSADQGGGAVPAGKVSGRVAAGGGPPGGGEPSLQPPPAHRAKVAVDGAHLVHLHRPGRGGGGAVHCTAQYVDVLHFTAGGGGSGGGGAALTVPARQGARPVLQEDI